MAQVSVIMTVYNGELYVEDAIKSILNQVDIDVELVIVDDGSIDETKNILERYSENRKVKVLYCDKIGRGEALNLAINNCNTKYIANLDADDFFHPDKLRIQYEIMQENGDIDVLSTKSILINEKNLFDEMNFRNYRIEKNTLNLHRVNKDIALGNPISHITVLMKKDVLESVNCYTESRTSQFDYDLWIKLAIKGYELYKLDIPLAYKRIHKDQNFERSKRIEYLLSSTKLQRKAIKELELPKRFYISSYFRFFYGLLPNKIRMQINKTR